MSLPRYPRYRDSGVKWLGKIPEHWQVSPIKHFSDTITDGAHISPVVDGGVRPFVSTKDVEEERIDWENCLLTTQESFDYMVKAGCRPLVGDVLFSKDGTIGRTVLVREEREFVVASSLIIIRPMKTLLDSRFLSHLCQSHPIVKQVESYVKGAGLPRLSVQNLLKVFGCFPPLAEQRSIATFLERQTAKINELVSEQSRLTELLKEKRQAVISHVVTNGLNPDAPMKPSGIEWVAKVPAHWDTVRNKVIFEEIDQRSASASGELLTVSHITGVTPRAEKEVSMFLAQTLEGYKLCHQGDLVINTMWAWMGALGCSPCDGLVSPSYNVYRPRKPGQLVPTFYDYLCRIPSHSVAIRANSTGVWESRLRLYPDAFLDMRLAVPPVQEQLAIVDYLDSATAKWTSLVTEAERAIELLQERRTALITAAVTGQIDVRDVIQSDVA
jgi:type I restriction enzyme, S subunit